MAFGSWAAPAAMAGALLAAQAVAPARAEWVPVRDASLVVKPGSPLDFSGFASAPPIADRVVAGVGGTSRWHPGRTSRSGSCARRWAGAP